MDERGKQILSLAEKKVLNAFASEEGSHDLHHIFRVRENARWIMQNEGDGDPFFVELSALLHDVGDPKFFDGDIQKGGVHLEEWMQELGLISTEMERSWDIISSVSFKGLGADDRATDIDARIVQDADRLDAMGAIGIARAFAFGGSKGRPIHIPEQEAEIHRDHKEYLDSKSPTVQHFHEKLFHLKERMKTDTGRRIAEERHRFMEKYLERFHQEWAGKA